jgi:hypothetical protein
MVKRAYEAAIIASCIVISLLFLSSCLFNRRVLITKPVEFMSDDTWEVFNGFKQPLGYAQLVCLNDADPSLCSSGAKNYNWPGSGGWSADLSSIPGARWIWAQDVRGYPSDVSLATFTFKKSIHLPAEPTAAVMWVAADDSAIVRVNGGIAGSTGSVSNISDAARAQACLKIFDIRPFLHRGVNEISVIGENGPSFYAQGAERHPAGVVFGGRILFNYDKNP